MATFLCGRFRKGPAKIRTLTGQIVEFTNGRAEVNDPELCAALLEVPSVFKISLAEGEELPALSPPDGLVLPPGMSVATSLEWAGKDVERATLALEAEKAAGEFARATLVDRLEKVIAAAGTGD